MEKKEQYERVDFVQTYGIVPYSIWETDDPKYSNPIKKKLKEFYGQSTREGTLKSFGGAGDRTAFKSTTSYFNPALARSVYRSYAPRNGSVFDPFCSVVRPYVAMLEDMRYVGCEIREDEANKIQSILSSRLFESNVEVLHQDSLSYSTDEKFDLVFTCPPYWNLETYSDLPNDISTVDNYSAFMVKLGDIIENSVRFLKDDGYCAIVVGDFRDYSDGRKLINRLVPFCSDTISTLESRGLYLYDKVIIKKPLGTAPSRLKLWNKRKTVRIHEELLIMRKS